VRLPRQPPLRRRVLLSVQELAVRAGPGQSAVEGRDERRHCIPYDHCSTVHQLTHTQQGLLISDSCRIYLCIFMMKFIRYSGSTDSIVIHRQANRLADRYKYNKTDTMKTNLMYFDSVL